MQKLNLLNIDLNLLVAFEALVVEEHVSRAASRIGVSQPAMSRSLKQLREIFGDDLFRRTNEGMIPTPRAIELSRLIRPGLETIALAIGQKAGFDPSLVRRRFVIAMSDMATFLALPIIMKRLRAEAPFVEVVVLSAGNRDALAKVESGQVELAFGAFDYLPPTVDSLNVAPVHEVCIARPGHPAIGPAGLDLDLFLSLPHVAVAMNGDRGTPVDAVLETMGQKRRVVLTVSHFLPVPRLVLETDMVAVVADELLDQFPDGQQLARYELPFPLERVMAQMVWHRRFDEDPGHRWLRQLVAAASPAF